MNMSIRNTCRLAAIVAFSTVLTACMPKDYENDPLRIASAKIYERDKVKWARIAAAGYCVPQSSFFGISKPNCKPIPPGEINNLTFALMPDYFGNTVPQGEGRRVVGRPMPGWSGVPVRPQPRLLPTGSTMVPTSGPASRLPLGTGRMFKPLMP